jgi:predicted ATPase/DNA-binding SARP family transcriptional activator
MSALASSWWSVLNMSVLPEERCRARVRIGLVACCPSSVECGLETSGMSVEEQQRAPVGTVGGRVSVEFRVLGPLEVIERDLPLQLGGAKQRAVLAVLLLHRGEPVSRDRLIDELWGEDPPRSAAKTLQGYISHLRKAVGEGFVVTRGGGYQLSLAPGHLDLDEFERLAAEGEEALAAGQAASAADRLRAALALWRGRPLADFAYEPFAQAAIGRLEEARLAALEKRIDADLALGRHDRLVSELEALVREHPLRERLRAQRMLALYGAGRQAEALEAYRQARRALSEQLGIEPGPELRQLEHAILAQDPELASPVRRPMVPRRTNLPAPARPLLGRDRELRELITLARAARLLTLTGPGGTGKTRLALELAVELGSEFPDGAWWVALESLSDPALVEQTIAEAVDARERLAEHLADKRLLIVLDNFEQLLAAAPLLGDLLSLAPELSLIATSRERLGLSAEQEYPVAPLAEAAAVSLFTARARQLIPGFEPDPSVAEICRRVDGLPLAVELAATRVKVLTPAQILARLEHRLEFLTAGARDAPERQQTILATIDWSYRLLTDGEQRLLRGLAVFVGTFELDAAEEVCQTDLATLQSLVDKSLVVRGGEGRFLLLGTIREYALARLEQADETQTMRRRHAQWFFELGASAQTGIRSDQQSTWLSRLRADTDNLRAALAWAVEHDIPRGVELARALFPPWHIRGSFSELLGWFEQALADPKAIPPPVRALGLSTFGRTLFFHQDYERAAEVLQESLALLRRLGDEREQARVLNALGGVHWATGEGRQAVSLREQALAIHRRLGDRAGEAQSLHLLGEELRDAGQFERATALLEQAVAINTELGDRLSTSFSLHSLADAALDQQNTQRADEFYKQALAIADQFEDHWNQAYCLAGLACVAALNGDRDCAARLWGAAQAVEDQFKLRMLSRERARYERILVPLADDPAFQAAVQTGRALSLQHLVASLTDK